MSAPTEPRGGTAEVTYRQKPVVVEAVQYAGKGNVVGAGAPEWVFKAFERKALRPTNGGDPLRATTLHGDVTVKVGYWIVQDARGHLSIHRPEDFDYEYEPTSSDQAKGPSR